MEIKIYGKAGPGKFQEGISEGQEEHRSKRNVRRGVAKMATLSTEVDK